MVDIIKINKDGSLKQIIEVSDVYRYIPFTKEK